MSKLRIWHISDTHTYHGFLKVPDNIDMVIFSGDCSNPRDPVRNENEVKSFLTWFSGLPIKHKIMIAGNHDSSIEAGYVDKSTIQSLGITYLENGFTIIEGIKIWGSPYTPAFGNWSFMKARGKINRVWDTIPEDTDIVVIHGPPKGILDHSYNPSNQLEQCGCSALKKRMLKLQPKLCMFGHIHNCEDIINAGTLKLSEYKTIFSNGSVMTDGKFTLGPTSNGNILEI